MIARTLTQKILALAKVFPVITVTGPRQSGKTTLLKAIFPDKQYVSLEDPDTRIFAQNDPRAFLANLPDGGILDEVQRVPALLSYLQTRVDQNQIMGEFILSGTQNLLLMDQLSQTLAGRTALLKLLPLSNFELEATEYADQNWEERVINGGYPRIYDKNILPSDFYASYFETYVERDVRQLKNIQNLDLFTKFVMLCAGRTGQLLNITSLANDCGISHHAAQSWLSLLQTSYVIFLLQPHFENFSKRIVKMPKLYFYDTGLAAHLLKLNEAEQLKTHYIRGGLFENMILNEIQKHYYNQGNNPPIYFWRDQTGHEIDCMIESASCFDLIEIKSAMTFQEEFLKQIRYFRKLNNNKKTTTAKIVYTGDFHRKQDEFELLPWNKLYKSLN